MLCVSHLDAMAQKEAIVLFLCMQILNVCCLEVQMIKVSKNGTDSPECRNASVVDKPPCLTLDYVFKGGQGISSNTQILVGPGDFTLSNDTQFEGKHNISLQGGGSSYTNYTITCGANDVGLSFLRCQGITITGLSFRSCGRMRNSTSKQEIVRSGIHFVFSKYISISTSAITKSRGTGLTMVDTGGNVTLQKVYIEKNSFNGSGGGIFIATTICGALDLANCTSQLEQQQYIHNASFTFKDLVLSLNFHNASIANSFEETHHPKAALGRGGGLTIHLTGNASLNQFSFITCSFYKNGANWGGGIYIGISDQAQGNIITLTSGMFFWRNQAYFGGGAVQITLMLQDYLKKQNMISFSSVYFGKNSAIWGGAVSVKANTRILRQEMIISKTILLESCGFYFNKATVGSAVALATNNRNYYSVGPGVSYALALTNCIISQNTITTSEDKRVIGQGAVYAEEFMLYVNTTQFKRNTGTALVLDSASFTVYGNVTFLSNHGINGGAIGLYGNSWIKLTRNSQLLLESNVAEIKGGAIYVKSAGPSRLAFSTTKLATAKCFFRYEEQVKLDPSTWECKIRFRDNSAPGSTGSSIFANTLQMCRHSGESRMNNTALEWPNVFEYGTKLNSSYPEIATEAIQIISNVSQWHASPSVPFTPQVLLLDEKGNSVYGTVKVEVSSKDDPKMRLDPPNNVFLIKDAIHDIRVVGTKAANFNLSFMTTDGQLVKTKTVEQSLNYCPPGYEQKTDSYVCTCMEADKAITRCENYTAFLIRGYWGYAGKDHKFHTLKCPKHYCECSLKSEKILYECPFTSIKCTNNRVGILCGKCKMGFSVKLGNEVCEKCSNVYLLLLIPIIFVASVFVLFVFYFNIDAFSGYLNAFLYSYQSIDTVLPEIIKLDPFIGFVIGTLCLSGTGNTFGLCLYDGFTDLEKLGFNLAVPVYILLFTILVGTCLSGDVFQKLFGNSLRSRSFGRALSFVYTYCYTALTSKALALLNPVTINGELMVYSAPDVAYFGKEHIGYAIVAILILIVFTIGFPIILLFTPFFTERFPSIARMEPAFNVLKLCFKNPINSKSGSDYRAFAAFYFLCRVIVLLFDIFVKDETPRLVLIAVSSVFFQVIFTWFQPYIIWTMNFWDVTLLTNMCLISLVSIILSVPYILSDLYRGWLEYLLYVLVYVPLVVIFIRLVDYCRSRRNRHKRSSSTKTEDEVPSKRSRLRVPFLARRRARNSRVPRRLHEDEPSELSEGATSRGFPS